MPSKTPKQAKFMRAIAHGWTPSRMQSPPSRAVAQEFVDADRKYSGGFAENRYWTGGLAAMNEVNAGYKGRLDWADGGYAEGGKYGTEPLSMEDVIRLGGRGGPGAAGSLIEIQQMGWRPDPETKMFFPPDMPLSGTEPTIAAVAPTTTYSGPRLAGPRGGRRGGGGRGGRRNGDGGGGAGGGGGPGGPGAVPPRIIETDPASYVGTTSASSREGSDYRKQLRKHQRRIENILGSARGGHVNYYEEGGTVRPGHAEGPNPFEGRNMPGSYARWERENHIDPPPPPEPEPEPEEVPWYKRLVGYGKPTKTDEALAEMEQAYGGRVNYQTGGLAQVAPGRMLPPAGGVPPWIEPIGSGPGYGDEEPQGYQFGGAASRFRGARGRMPYRGVPPQRAPIRQAPTRGFRGMAARGELGPGTTTRYRDGMPVGGGPAPTGGLAAMIQRAQQQRAGVGPQVMDLPAPGPNDTVYDRDWPPRGPMAPGGGPLQLPRGEVGINPPPTRPFQPPPGREVIGGSGQIGDPYQYGRMTRKPRPGPGGIVAGEGIPGGGNIPPWKRLPGSRRAPPPGPGPEGIPGGPRVPPNMTGYLQKMRMQNRPPSGPVGGGGNRVGMQDQQGALSRALQRGTGRPPMSRRSAFGRAGPTR